MSAVITPSTDLAQAFQASIVAASSPMSTASSVVTSTAANMVSNDDIRTSMRDSFSGLSGLSGIGSLGSLSNNHTSASIGSGTDSLKRKLGYTFGGIGSGISNNQTTSTISGVSETHMGGRYSNVI